MPQVPPTDSGPTAGPSSNAADSLLGRIVAQKEREIAQLVEPFPPRADRVRSFANAIRRRDNSALRVIAECKKASPSKGLLRSDYNPASIAADYERLGAAALSVLTDEHFFQGSADDLRAARAAVGIPVLRKDFTIEEIQIREAASLGADAVLLIVRLLGPSRLKALLAEARSVGLDALVETHSAEEVELALGAGAQIIGINHRDLDTLEMDLSLTERLAPRIRERDPQAIVIAESGVESADGCGRVAPFADAVLVGTALMQSSDLGSSWRALFA